MPILIGVAVVVVILLIVIAMRPSEFLVRRSTAVNAPPGAAFAQVNDLHKWEAWSPWAKIDPAAKTTYEGPGAGVGAVFNWSGNNKVGQGRMTITESRPAELVRFKLEFQKPMKATNIAEFTFKPDGGQTTVTWSMTGKCNFVGKAFGLFCNFDKMVGGQFEKGLTDMKALVEASAKK